MKKNTSKISDLLALTVFAAFALCVLIVLLYGAQVYQTLVRRGEESFWLRTGTQYVATRVRQADNVDVADFDGCEALNIREEIGGTIFVTRIYCYEGFLRELFCAQSAALAPEDGEKILPAGDLQLHIEGDRLTASVDGNRIVLQLRGKAGGKP